MRAEKAQIDSWAQLGNPGWSWDDLFPYYIKSEGFSIPSLQQEVESGASFVEADHGANGPLKVGYLYGMFNGSFHQVVEETWGSLGIPHNEDVNGGSVRGFTVFQSTVDRDTNLREDAARAYYWPFQQRENLKVFMNTTVNRIVWKENDDGDGCVVANGVEVTDANGALSILRASKEVIVSAGSLRTPTILELSGIGNPLHVLNPIFSQFRTEI